MKPLHRPKIAAFLVTVFSLILAISLSIGETIARAETPPQISNQVYDPDNKLGSASAKVTEELSSLAEDGLEIYVAFPQDYGLLTPTDWNLKALQNTGAAANAYIVSIIADYPNQTVYLASGNDYAQLDQDRISALAQTYLEPLLNQQKYGDAVVAFAQALAKEAPEGANGSKISPWAMVVILTLLVLVVYIFARLFKIRRQLRANRLPKAPTAVPADSTPLPSSTLNNSFEDEAATSQGPQTASVLDSTPVLDLAPELSSAYSHAQPSSLTGASNQVDSKLKDKSAPDTTTPATSAEQPRHTSSPIPSLPVQSTQSSGPDTLTFTDTVPSAYPGDAENAASDLQSATATSRFSNKRDSVLKPGAITYMPPQADDQDTATTSLSEIKEYGQNRIPSSTQNEASPALASQPSAKSQPLPPQDQAFTGGSQPGQAETPRTDSPTDQDTFQLEVAHPNAIPIIPASSLSVPGQSVSSSPASTTEKNTAAPGEGKPARQPKPESSYQAGQEAGKKSISSPPPNPSYSGSEEATSGRTDSAANLADSAQAGKSAQPDSNDPSLSPANNPENLKKSEADTDNHLANSSADPQHTAPDNTPDTTPANATDATSTNTAADTTAKTSKSKAASSADNQALEFTKVVRQADNWSRRGIEKLQLAQQRFGKTETHSFALAQAEAANAVRVAFSEFASAQLEARSIRKEQIYDQLTEPIKQLQHQISQFTGQYHRQTPYANLERHFQGEITSLLGNLKASKTELRTSGVLDSDTLQRLDSDYQRAETWLSQASRLLQQARKATTSTNQIEKLTVRVENLLIKANALRRMSESELLKATQNRKAQAASENEEKLSYLLEAAAGAMASVDDYINMYTNRIGVAARTMLVLANRTLSRLDLNPNLSAPDQLRIAQRAYQQAQQAQQLARNDVAKSLNEQYTS